MFENLIAARSSTDGSSTSVSGMMTCHCWYSSGMAVVRTRYRCSPGISVMSASCNGSVSTNALMMKLLLIDPGPSMMVPNLVEGGGDGVEKTAIAY